MKRVRLVVVTGLSGSGKTAGLKALEDLGFYCVDNLPVELLPNFLELSVLAGGELHKVAVGMDLRERHFLEKYRQAFEHLSDQILERAGIIYVQVSFEESQRKNRKRFNPERPDSILEHAVDDKKLETLYRHDDWNDLVAGSNPGDILQIRQHKVPFVTFENEDDVTTRGGAVLGDRLQDACSRLWDVHHRAERP